MAETTDIAWARSTFNHVRGCTMAQASEVDDGEIAEECKRCYAAQLSKRNPSTLGTWGDESQGTRVVAAESYWKQPLKWDRMAQESGEEWRVFCASMGDVFEDWDGPMLNHTGGLLGYCKFCKAEIARVKGSSHCVRCDCIGGIVRNATMDDVRRRLFGVIDQTPHLTWLLLTKRPENVLRMWPTTPLSEMASIIAGRPKDIGKQVRHNVWLGTSCGHPKSMWRIGELLKCRGLAANLFVSVEPMLGPVRLRGTGCAWCYGEGCMPSVPYIPCRACIGINWVIIGCESNGPRVGRLGEFKTESEWWEACADLVRQCREADVRCFVKQGPRNGRVVHDLADFPEPCRVREFPERKAAT